MIPEEKQGHLGNLSDKPTEEIKDLLRRQNALAENKKFMQRLQDKGEKILLLIERLKQELKQREHVDETADLFHQMSLDAERKARRAGTSDESLKDIIHSGDSEKMVIDERTEEPDAGPINSYERVIKKSTGKPQHRAKFYPNRSAKTTDVNEVKEKLSKDSNISNRDVIVLSDKSRSPAESNHGALLTASQQSSSKCEKDVSSEQRSSEKDNQEVLSRQMELSERLSGGGASSGSDVMGGDSVMNTSSGSSQSRKQFVHKTLQDQGVGGKPMERLKYRYDENLELNTYGPPTRHNGTKLVDLQESMQLMQHQTSRLETLQAEQAVEKLSASLGFKLINPEGSSLKKYREVADTDDDTSDDENEAQDYPD